MNKLRTVLTAFGIGLAVPAQSAPVVVELFTSQGCSSCPDADAVISKWGASEFKKGSVLPLTYNVDYWNYLGWRDVFSTPVYSQRQRRYASALGVGVYTPQMVVAGRSAFVGSDGGKAQKEASRLQRREASRISLSGRIAGNRLKLAVAVQPMAEAAGKPRLMLAIFENGLVTEVSRGENSGSALRNDFVVRRLVDLGPYGRKFVDEAWDAAWKKENCGAAVFVQDLESMEILDAASLYPLTETN